MECWLCGSYRHNSTSCPTIKDDPAPRDIEAEIGNQGRVDDDDPSDISP
jgi:hypothetical protein